MFFVFYFEKVLLRLTNVKVIPQKNPLIQDQGGQGIKLPSNIKSWPALKKQQVLSLIQLFTIQLFKIKQFSLHKQASTQFQSQEIVSIFFDLSRLFMRWNNNSRTC